MSPLPPSRRPTEQELRAIARGGTVTAEVMRWLREEDDGSVAARLEALRQSPDDGDRTVVGEHLVDASDERFLEEFAEAHRQGRFGEGTVIDPPEAAGYEIIREISRGAQGAVFLARQIATRRQVALKVLLRAAFSSERAHLRFEREVEMVASLNHPNIVTIFDSGITPDGRAWVAMEFIDGLPLDAHLSQHAPADAHQRRRLIARMIADACEAVAAAHRRGIIHRDLKPDNMLVDADHHPHVLDFGLAKPVDPGEWDSSRIEVTTAGEFMGTFAYAAPEQVSGDPDAIDVRTDVFALGVILYEALLQQRPFDLEGSLADVIRAIAAADVRAPRLVDPTIPVDLETILLRALEHDSERRYSGPADLARDLRHWLHDEPIEARRDDAWYVARKFLRRHWVPVSAACAGVIILAVFGIVMTVAWDRAVQANQRLTGTVGMVSSVLASSDAENLDQPLAASSVFDMMQRWLDIVNVDLAEYPQIAAGVQLDLAETLIGAGRLDEAQTALDAARSGVEVSIALPSTLAGRLLHLEGRLRYKRADYEAALTAYSDALSHRRRTQPGTTDTAETVHHIGATLGRLNRMDESARFMQEAMQLHRDLLEASTTDDEARRRRAALGNLLNSMGVGLIVNRPEAALPYLRQSLDLFLQDSADPDLDWRIATIRQNIGDCLVRLDQWDEAHAMLLTVLETRTAHGSGRARARTEKVLARLALARGDTPAARRHIDSAAARHDGELPAGHPSLREEQRINIEILIHEDQLEDAARELVEARQHARSPATLADVDRLGGLLALAHGDPEQARRLLQTAYGASMESSGATSPRSRRIARDLADVLRALGDSEADTFERKAQPPDVESMHSDAATTPATEPGQRQ